MQNIKNNYSHIIIIGNGFDLNQGLKTGYVDFINSDSFKKLLKKDNNFADYLYGKHELGNWIDIENELKTYSISQDNKSGADNFERDFNMVSNALKEYLCTLSYENIDKTAYSFKLIEQLREKDFLILDFNYTKMTENILFELGIADELDKRLIKVHGSLEEEEIIFGVEDSARILPQHVFLRKAFHKSFKAININTNLANLKELYIFGHSLGETDHMYFSDFFINLGLTHYSGKGKNLILFHYGQDSYRQLLMQIDYLTMKHLTTFKQNINFQTFDTSKKVE
jgi:hypothetical protein